MLALALKIPASADLEVIKAEELLSSQLLDTNAGSLLTRTINHVSRSYVLIYYSCVFWRPPYAGCEEHQLPSPEDQLHLDQEEPTAVVGSSGYALYTEYDDFLPSKTFLASIIASRGCLRIV